MAEFRRVRRWYLNARKRTKSVTTLRWKMRVILKSLLTIPTKNYRNQSVSCSWRVPKSARFFKKKYVLKFVILSFAYLLYFCTKMTCIIISYTLFVYNFARLRAHCLLTAKVSAVCAGRCANDVYLNCTVEPCSSSSKSSFVIQLHLHHRIILGERLLCGCPLYTLLISRFPDDILLTLSIA